MNLKYISDIPFEYVVSNSNKDIKLSGELKEKFNHYYIEIKESDSFDSDRWVEDFQNLKLSVSEDVRKSGNHKSIYVADYVEFIFGVSYLLFKKFHFSQNEVSKILGIKPTKYAKLGIYPYRCYSAYTKLDDKKNRKSLVPDDSNSIGIQIAECINKKVQAVYACSAFVGVSNNLDLFANISSTDAKKYITTIPHNHTTNISVCMQQTIGYIRFIFATANNLKDAKGHHVSGKIKKKIINLLEMKDDNVLCYSTRLKKMLDEGLEYRNYIRGEREDFDILLSEYRVYKRFLSEIEEDEKLPIIEWDEEYEKFLDILEDGLEYTEDNLEEIIDLVRKKIEELEMSLIKKMSYAVSRKYNVENFSDYRNCLLLTVCRNIQVDLNNLCSAIDKMSLDDKVRYAAIYWILEVAGLEQVTEENLIDWKKYFKTKKLLEYFDSMNKEIVENVEDKKKKDLHIFLKLDNFNILEEINALCMKKVAQDRPVMLYVDTTVYPNISNVIDKLMNNKIVLIIRDIRGVVDKCRLTELNKELNLYYYEGEANDDI